MTHIFPHEILNRIARHLRKPDLFSLSLTCSEFRDIAIPYIWESLKVSIRWQQQEGDAPVRWIPGNTTPTAAQLRHVKKFDMYNINPAEWSSAEQRVFGQALKFCFVHMTSVQEINTEDFSMFPYWELMDRSILADLAAIRSLTRLTLRFPEPDLFSTSAYEEILGHLERLGNLHSLTCLIQVESGPRETLALARILANCPTIRYLQVGSCFEIEDDEISDETWDDIKQCFAAVCFRYSEIRNASVQKSETARLRGDWETYRRLAVVPLLSLNELRLEGSTIVCPEIHQLADTQCLTQLAISTSGLIMDRGNPYDDTQGALQLLAGRASKLTSLTLEGQFDEATAGPGLKEISKNFPGLSELTVSDMAFSETFVDLMWAVGGAGPNATMWKRLTLDWADATWDDMDIEDMVNPLLAFITDCVNLVYLRTHVSWYNWDRFVVIVSGLSQLRELHVRIESPRTSTGEVQHTSPHSNADRVRELFDRCSSLNMARVMMVENHGEVCPLWKRCHDGVRPVNPSDNE